MVTAVTVIAEVGVLARALALVSLLARLSVVPLRRALARTVTVTDQVTATVDRLTIKNRSLLRRVTAEAMPRLIVCGVTGPTTQHRAHI